MRSAIDGQPDAEADERQPRDLLEAALHGGTGEGAAGGARRRR
ncbi:hypothetical protein ACFQY7_22980 [Actinomadura luteofluorescens]